MADIFYRPTTCTGFIGTLGTGKTCKEEELIKLWIRDNPTGLIYGFVPDPQSNLKKYITNPIDKHDPNWALKYTNVINSLFVLDDYQGLMQSRNGSQLYTPGPGMTDLFTRRRYSNNDIMFSCHGPRAIIPQLTMYITHYVIYKTSVDEGSFDNRMYGWAKMQKAAKMVNGYCELIGNKGFHPLDPMYNGQGFPHVILDITTGLLTPVNMKRSLFKEYVVK